MAPSYIHLAMFNVPQLCESNSIYIHSYTNSVYNKSKRSRTKDNRVRKDTTDTYNTEKSTKQDSNTYMHRSKDGSCTSYRRKKYT